MATIQSILTQAIGKRRSAPGVVIVIVIVVAGGRIEVVVVADGGVTTIRTERRPPLSGILETVSDANDMRGTFLHS